MIFKEFSAEFRKNECLVFILLIQEKNYSLIDTIIDIIVCIQHDYGINRYNWCQKDSF